MSYGQIGLERIFLVSLLCAAIQWSGLISVPGFSLLVPSVVIISVVLFLPKKTRKGVLVFENKGCSRSRTQAPAPCQLGKNLWKRKKTSFEGGLCRGHTL